MHLFELSQNIAFSFTTYDECSHRTRRRFPSETAFHEVPEGDKAIDYFTDSFDATVELLQKWRLEII